MMAWEFRDPLFLLTALLAPVVYHLLARRAPATVMYSTLHLVDQAPRSLKARLAHAPALLWALAVVAMAIALAGPRTPDATTKVYREGIAIVMVVDRSSSMDARDLDSDVNVNRLDVVKSVFEQFVQGGNAGAGRADDPIGLIAFARYADGLCPLTLDHGNLLGIVHDLTIVNEQSEDGTALGEGLALAVERLRKHTARSKVVILLTDGVNNAGDIAPLQAAELARQYNVKVYCIGAGTQGWAPVPQIDAFTGRRVFGRAYVQIDEDTLKQIADKTGGTYFRATDKQALADIYRAIDRLERTKITEVRYMQYHEWYEVLVMLALGLIAVGGVLQGTWLRRLP